MPPALSVIMPAYNAQAYIAEAVRSILEQTFTDFEFLIVNDGSTDRTGAILEDFARKDQRIRYISRANTGHTVALNEMLGLARAPLIARMDADDIALPTRFEKQVAYMAAHPECVALGTQVELVDPDGLPLCPMNTPLTHEGIEHAHLTGGGTSIIHPTAVFRLVPVQKLGGYRVDFEPTEDLDLWLWLGEVGRLANLGEILLRYRRHPRAVGYERRREQALAYEATTRDAYRRRGLPWPETFHNPLAGEPTPGQERRTMGWRALMGGNVRTARRYAWSSLKSAPWSVESWKLAACALRGR